MILCNELIYHYIVLPNKTGNGSIVIDILQRKLKGENDDLTGRKGERTSLLYNNSRPKLCPKLVH